MPLAPVNLKREDEEALPLTRRTQSPVEEANPVLVIHLRNVLRGLAWDENNRKVMDIIELALVGQDERIWALVRKRLLDVFNAHERLQSACITQLFMPDGEEQINEDS